MKEKQKKTLRIHTNAIIESIDAYTGQINKREEVHNIVTTVGLDEFVDSGLSTFNYLAIGTDATAETIGDTALGTEITRENEIPSVFANASRRYDVTFVAASGQSESIAEYGVFNSLTPSGSIMLNRLTSTPFAWDVDNNIRVRITITVDNA